MTRLELKLPPDLLLLIWGVASYALARALPSTRLPPSTLWTVLALLVAGLGLTVVYGAIWTLRHHRTSSSAAAPDEASHLVTSGIYGYTRNPVYLGMLILLIAWALFLRQPLAHALLPLFVFYLTRFQIVPEERILAKTFAEPYAAYRRSVRRWL